MITFNDDGAWSWFQDERAIIHRGKLIIGSASRRGDIEATVYDLGTGALTRSTLQSQQRYDDHNAPAFLARPDGRVLAVYAKHGSENRFHYRLSSPDAETWEPQRVFVPSETSRVTYSNLFSLRSEGNRIYNFFRGLDNSFKPSYAWSDDGGQSWNTGNVVIDVPATVRHRPYVKYASDGSSTIHFLYTEGHPRDFNNSVYHVYYRGGMLYRSDGRPIRSLREGLNEPGEGTRVFQGDPDSVAWVSDLHLDRRGHPVAVYSVQKNSAGLPPGQGGDDLRYRYARWTGTRWEDHEIAHAGSRLYAGEDDYTGNMALDPDDPDSVYISTNVDPVTGVRKPHYEIYRGTAGPIWKWTPLTADSASDNIRPIVPKSGRGQTVVLWLRGQYTSYTNYDLAVVGMVLK